MHSAGQIIAQRAPPAIRTKPRWQPYHSAVPSNTLLRSPTASTYSLNTPAVEHPKSVLPCKDHLLAQTQPPQTTQDLSQRDATKHKFAAGLIDQAVNILSEIWRPQDVPDIFKAPSKGSSMTSAIGHPISTHSSFSSINITATQTPITAMMAHSQSSFTSPTAQGRSPATDNNEKEAESNLLPMKTFVHEVLKRSRTSGSILQAALCYLEAIRPKVPVILAEEKMGIRPHYQPESKILPATEAELAREAELTALEEKFAFAAESIEHPDSDALKTVRVIDADNDHSDGLQQRLHEGCASTSSLIVELSAPVETSSPPPRTLPSPLLCPRRAFLASLILASKFFQDKCYSNRAWAKLSGLPPREIGRCERALGQALEWRLWVGKSSIPPSSRNLVRSQSEIIPSATSSSETSVVSRPLRKCSTVPANAFAAVCTPSFDQRNASHDQDISIGTDKTDCLVSAQFNLLLPTLMCRNNIQMSITPTVSLLAPQPQSAEERSSTPSPETPGLTYSPSSTDSSSDRSSQLSFEDPQVRASTYMPWNGESLTSLPTITLPLGGNSKQGTLFGSSQPAVIVSAIDSELASFGSHIDMWRADRQYMLEAAAH